MSDRETALEEARAYIARERRKIEAQVRAEIEMERLLRGGDIPDLDDDGKRDSRTRRYQQWMIAQSDLDPTSRTVLHAVALRMSGYGDPSFASYETLAADASVARSTVYDVLGRAEAEGLIERTPGETRAPHLAVALDLDDDGLGRLYALWRTPADEEIGRWEDALEESYEPWGPAWKTSRYAWTRAIRDTSLPTPGKGIAWALGLLIRRETGLPVRGTTYDELGSLSGYVRATVRRHLRALEDGDWIGVQRPPGRGLYIRLDLPTETREQLAIRDEIRAGIGGENEG